MKMVKKIIPFLKARFAPRGARQYFSESGEDVLVSNILKKMGVRKVFYIDIGAHHPIFGNNTYLFYKNGGKGIIVEPNESLFTLSKHKRSGDISLNVGAGRFDGEENFYEFSQSTRSTFSKSQAEEWERKSLQNFKISKRKILSLDTLIRAGEGRIPDFVSIDAEGLDIEILSGFSFSKRPKVFCVENQNERILPLMEKHGYKLAGLILQNAIFVDNKI